MDILLSDDFDKFIKEQMATGLYNSVNDIVQEAMSLFRLRKSISQESIDTFNQELKKGLDDIETNCFSDGDDFFNNLIKTYE